MIYFIASVIVVAIAAAGVTLFIRVREQQLTERDQDVSPARARHKILYNPIILPFVFILSISAIVLTIYYAIYWK